MPAGVSPTAHALLADVAATAVRFEPVGAEWGTRRHAVPFQLRISDAPPLVPTAQALRAEVAATARPLSA